MGWARACALASRSQRSGNMFNVSQAVCPSETLSESEGVWV